MQNPISSYLDTLRETRRSELTIKATRQTLQSFQVWWETDRNRPFDLALLRDADLDWNTESVWKTGRMLWKRLPRISCATAWRDDCSPAARNSAKCSVFWGTADSQRRGSTSLPARRMSARPLVAPEY